MIKLLKLAQTNSFALLFEKVFRLTLSIAIISIMAKDFGVSLFGDFNSQIALCTLFIPFASLGLNKLVLKKMALDEDIKKAQNILSSAIAARFIAGLLISIISFAFFQNYAISFFLFTQSFLAFQLCESVLQYEGKFKFVSYIRLLITLLFTVIKLAVLKLYPTVDAMLIVFAFEILIIGIALLIIFKLRSSYRLSIRINTTLIISLLKSSLLLMISGVVATVYLKFDIIMLQYLGSSHEAGIYSAAARISEAWIFIPTILLARFYPVLLSLQSTNKELYKVSLQYLMDKTFLFGLIVVFIIFLSAPLIITGLYGEGFFESILILQLHSLATLFIAMRLLVSQWLIMNEGYMLSLLSHAAGAILNVILNYLLISNYGALGATIATILSYFTATYLCFFLSKKGREIRSSISQSFMFFTRYEVFFNMQMPWRNRGF